MSYFKVHGLDMWGGDISSKVVLGYDVAIHTAKELISNDPSKCATVRNVGGESYCIWLKMSNKTNPTNTSNHNCVSIFYGTQC
jgi:hypothetical protein